MASANAADRAPGVSHGHDTPENPSDGLRTPESGPKRPVVEFVETELELRAARGFETSQPVYVGWLSLAVEQSEADLFRDIAEAVAAGELKVRSIEFEDPA